MTEYQQEQEQIKRTKPHLRFSIGDVVYLKSDTHHEKPMTIKNLLNINYDREDYVVAFWNEKGDLLKELLPDEILTGKNE
jgi:hypothetical protein